jgi:perosamine synthetase
VYVVALAPEVDRARVMADLRERGVDAAEYVPCIHLQSYMRESFGFSEGLCPVAEEISSRTMALPFYPEIDPGDQEYVVEALRAALG